MEVTRENSEPALFLSLLLFQVFWIGNYKDFVWVGVENFSSFFVPLIFFLVQVFCEYSLKIFFFTMFNLGYY